MLSNFHFLRPYWFLSLIPTIILLFYFFKCQDFNNVWSKNCDKHLLNHLIKKNHNISNKFFYSIFSLIMLLVTFTLAGPTWSMSYQHVFSKNSATILALDVSSNMNTTDLAPSRMERAKFKVLDILKSMNEGQTGMLVFSSQAFVVSPLTSDSNTIANMVPVIDTNIVPVQGNNISKALTKSAELINQAGFPNGKIILITSSIPDSQSLSIASSLRAKGFSLSVLGVGTVQGGPALSNNGGSFAVNGNGSAVFNKLDESSLIALSQRGGGIYETLTYNNDDINSINGYNKNIDSSLFKNSGKSKFGILWKDQGCIFIWVILLLIFIISRKGWLSKLC